MSKRAKPSIKNVRVRFPIDLLTELKQAAAESERSQNSEIVFRLKRSMAERASAKKTA